jgi:hypothetical protein
VSVFSSLRHTHKSVYVLDIMDDFLCWPISFNIDSYSPLCAPNFCLISRSCFRDVTAGTGCDSIAVVTTPMEEEKMDGMYSCTNCTTHTYIIYFVFLQEELYWYHTQMHKNAIVESIHKFIIYLYNYDSHIITHIIYGYPYIIHTCTNK